MDDTPTVQTPANPSHTRQRGGRAGHRGGRGGPQNNVRGNSRGRGRGRGGRGGREIEAIPHADGSSNPPDLAPSIPPPPGLRPPGTFGARLTEDAKNVEGEEGSKGKSRAEKSSAQDDDAEGEVCFICASPVAHHSVAPCSHRTCHICALRLRALYKNKTCAHCRTEAEHVIFTDDPTKKYQEFQSTDFAKEDETLGIKYENEEIFEDTVLLLRYNCPDQDCDIACLGWPDLHRHVKNIHHKVMCDLCTRNKKVFTHEHELFTNAELRKHEKFGDDHPGAVDQSGFRGHPECGFCRKRFYGDDELYTHCREKHERCHICDRRNEGRNQQYYVDYNSLEQHFGRDHFLCLEKECLEKKFVVFDSEIDLKAHQLEDHPNSLSKDARRDAQRVDLSSFNYRAPLGQADRGRQGRLGGRGRDPNTEPLPRSSAQPLRRDELAYQRQMAIHSAQSISTRSFGGQLSSHTPAPSTRTPGPATQTATQPAQRPAPRPTPRSNGQVPEVGPQNLNSNSTDLGSTADLTPQEQARRLRHSTVIERASNLLKNDPVKIASFRTKVSSYQHSSLSATELIDSFFSLFDVPAADLGKLIKELAEIYENENKRNALLKSWGDWRAINEDYPALPGPSGIIPGSSAAATGSGGKRVLRLKNSTAQSSRSAVSKQGSWGGTSANPNIFPPISSLSRSRGPTPSASSTNLARSGAGAVGSTPAWVSASRPSPSSSRPVSRNQAGISSANDAEAFPALPAAKKPNTTLWGMNTAPVRRVARNEAANAWGTTGSTVSAEGSGQNQESIEATSGKKAKGNKGKKQTLYRFG
ncbi:MAG: hypothetical protein M1834_006484 [Cirrosporium novae-zelandiae]|nr:MAG: hypothetical protein M1834_006484 [Cirrosporium novae-zelandiae]